MHTRIIPARAGFTLLFQEETRWLTDHPRSRGVYLASQTGHQIQDGSSPLARGLPYSPSAFTAANRIIPARAGFTNDFKSKVITAQDHPRSRGVYCGPVRRIEILVGSSPLARGLPVTGGDGFEWGGIIPARAGFTTSSACDRPHARDHPRSRGVYRTCVAGRDSSSGSSPLARGLRSIP